VVKCQRCSGGNPGRIYRRQAQRPPWLPGVTRRADGTCVPGRLCWYPQRPANKNLRYLPDPALPHPARGFGRQLPDVIGSGGGIVTDEPEMAPADGAVMDTRKEPGCLRRKFAVHGHHVTVRLTDPAAGVVADSV